MGVLGLGGDRSIATCQPSLALRGQASEGQGGGLSRRLNLGVGLTGPLKCGPQEKERR